jgi:hypothetical protein
MEKSKFYSIIVKLAVYVRTEGTADEHKLPQLCSALSDTFPTKDNHELMAR